MAQPLIIFCERDYCMSCDNPHSIELVDVYGNSIPIMNITEKDINVRRFEYAHCTHCGQQFNIDWSFEDRLPRAMFSNFGLEIYMLQF